MILALSSVLGLWSSMRASSDPKTPQASVLSGSWSYRSWINDPERVDVAPTDKICERLKKLLFAEATLTIEDASGGELRGKLDMGESGTLTLFGSVGYGSPVCVRFQGVGKG